MPKNPKGSSLSVFFGIVRLFSLKKFHKSSPNSPKLGNFEVLLLFLSLGYGADLGRSRLVQYTRLKKKFYQVIHFTEGAQLALVEKKYYLCKDRARSLRFSHSLKDLASKYNPCENPANVEHLLYKISQDR